MLNILIGVVLLGILCFGVYTWGHNNGVMLANSITDEQIIKNFEYTLFEKDFGYRHVLEDHNLVNRIITIYRHPAAKLLLNNAVIDICRNPDQVPEFDFNVTYSEDQQCFELCSDELGGRMLHVGEMV